MGKYFIEYGLPALALGGIAWWLVRKWYIQKFGDVVKHHQEVKKASKKYEKELNR